MKNIWKVTVACILAMSHAPSVSHAHPMSPVVSSGTNPIVNVAGRHSGGPGFVPVVTAPEGQDIVLTDLVFTTEPGGRLEPTLRIGDSGPIVGRYFVYGVNYASSGFVHIALQTGIRVPAGESLQLDPVEWDLLNYSFSGYYAQP